MAVLLILIILYLVIGMFMCHLVFSAASKIPITHQGYGAAQVCISHLKCFRRVSWLIFRWPSLLYTITRGGRI